MYLRIIGITALKTCAIAFVIFALMGTYPTKALACMCHGKGHDHGSSAPAQKSEKSKVDETAKCAIDGMEMNKSAMVKFDFKGKDYYVCSAEEKAEFLKSPEKYIKTAK